MRRMKIVLAALALGLPATALTAQQIAVHRDPGCGCCEKWAHLVRAQFGRQVRMIDDSQRAALHKRFGMPGDLASCHTAIIDGMAFEGHVPIADMKRALAQRPKGVSGLAVAGMPLGSPGMETPDGRKEAYDTLLLLPAGKRRVFARHA